MSIKSPTSSVAISIKRSFIKSRPPSNPRNLRWSKKTNVAQRPPFNRSSVFSAADRAASRLIRRRVYFAAW